MAIAIIGFAFVALIGLLPSGMSIFRGSLDTSNENWIMQDVNAMLQTTAWNKLEGMVAEKGGDVLIYDDEVKLVDRVTLAALTSDSSKDSKDWQYAVKLVIEPVNRPNEPTVLLSEDARLVTIVISPYRKAKALEEFLKITKAAEFKGAGYNRNSGLRTRSFIITRMDSALD